jgi:hypothetical protein
MFLKEDSGGAEVIKEDSGGFKITGQKEGEPVTCRCKILIFAHVDDEKQNYITVIFLTGVLNGFQPQTISKNEEIYVLDPKPS